MKCKICVLVLFLSAFISLFVSVPRVSADCPTDLQPWMIASASQGWGGSTPDTVCKAFRNYQDAQAKAHQWKSFEWDLNYGSTATEFLHHHGCASCDLLNGLSFPLQVSLPVGISDFLDILPVQFRMVIQK